MAHIHEKIDFTVEVFVVHENTVLLRKHDKYKIWLSVGGHSTHWLHDPACRQAGPVERCAQARWRGERGVRE